jgi:hypothetical protein
VRLFGYDNIDVDEDRSRRKDRCQRCGTPMTWAEQRRQFGRAIRYGLTVEVAKAEMPKCGKCVTELFSPHRRKRRMVEEITDWDYLKKSNS